MEISVKIDSLISQLSELKPKLSDNAEKNQHDFENILSKALKPSLEAGFDKTREFAKEVSNWRDSDYEINPNNPKKPNMRELMEALSGRSVEDLYADPHSDWKKLSQSASDILYGVVLSEDTRNWDDIMSSKNILKQAREQTNEMHKPSVDIESVINSEMEIIEQYAVIKDQYGSKLRSLSGNITKAEESLKNFGITAASIPKNIEAKITVKDFDEKILNTLKNISKEVPLSVNTTEPNSLRTIAFESATDVLARRLSNEIQLTEFSKL